MKSILPVSALVAFIVFSGIPTQSEARYGETFPQCIDRYGSPLKKIDGLDIFYGIATFGKDGIMITTVFDATSRRCVLVLYTRGDYTSFATRQNMKSLTDGEISTFKKTVEGRWIPLDKDPTADNSSTTFAGPRKIKPHEISVHRSIKRDPGTGVTATDIVESHAKELGETTRDAIIAFLKALTDFFTGAVRLVV